MGLKRLTRDGAFFGAGLLGLAAQVILLRELMVDVAGDELALGVGLAAWLVGIAGGARLGRQRPQARAARDAGVGLALLAVLPILCLICGRLLRGGLGPEAGELPGLGLTVSLALATLVPPGALVGWTFTALAAAASRRWRPGDAIARVYVVEALGSLAGGVCVALLVGPVLAPLPAIALLGVVGAATALAATRDGVLVGRVGLAGVLVLGLALTFASRSLDAWSEEARFAGLAPSLPLQAVRDTPWQHLALAGGDGVWHLYESGQYSGSFPDDYADESLGHLIGCLAPDPDRVVLLGGIPFGLVRVLLQHPVGEVVLVEPDPWRLSFIRERLPERDRVALGDPRVRVVHDDPRRFLARTRQTCGLIVVLGPEPVSLLRARLTAVEFLRLCGARLTPDGVLVVGVHTAPNVLTGETAALAGSVFGALREVLPVVRATPGPETLLVAGRDPEAVTLDPATLASRWERRGIETDSFAAALFPVLLPPGRVAEQEAALRAASTRVEASRDDRPASFVHALARRRQTTAGTWDRMVGTLSRLPAAPLVLLALLPSLVALARLWILPWPVDRRAASAASHAVAVTGAAGMGFSLLLLLSFQTRVGVLYGALGALTAVFMLGLALGAGLARRALGGSEDGAAGTAGLRLALASALAFAVALPWTLAAAARTSTSGPLAAAGAYGALLLAAGALVGTQFPLAATIRLAAGEGAGETAGRLETADHAGAAVAALLGAVLFIPTLGLARCAWLLAALLALALAGVARAGRLSPAPRS
jgi:spermidine synthase